ncbi:class I SAM-dependent DNA methyltransferase [Anaerovibrio lipolyticus]|uniref:site-specific DNA-methyltransferase (adenine-specific) n=1 Tax=Anaerovibrio lipolyticus TaxID=82374 RepID=A0A0B2JWY8_9FIRM|nr:N-6 DNA methylase [Anaerovibrio lipolyticus]KHM52820.1 type I restriction endonuclease subunit M [Anaerovibrio lipolyticus]
MAKSKRAEARCRYLVRSVATKKGWDVRHPQNGGQFLEEQEIEDYFKNSGLGKTKPDFLVCKNFQPIVVVEAKNEKSKIENAINEAIDYADAINTHGKYHVNIAVGVAGEEDNGYLFVTKFFDGKKWIDLTARGFVLTSFPSVAEVENAIQTNNGTTEVSIPNVSDYIVTAIDLSSILRSAKIEASLRPKVLGSVITAMYQGEIDLTEGQELASINQLVAAAINSTDHFEEAKKQQLIETLKMTEADYSRLAPKMGKIIYILKMLNIKSILQTDTDFLGLLYEAFIRYGYDNNSLGIVFTPRHITKYCADLIDVTAKDKVIDIACGSGGFLVASFDRMLSTYKEMGIPHNVIRESLYGFDTNPTVWALAALNMFFRGDGKSNIENASCFDESSRKLVSDRFTKALLNPPFSQEDEPERDFIDAAMDTLQTLGLMAVVVKSGIFADDDNSLWRNTFLKNHTLLGMISLPGDLFYPTAVDTTIMIAQAKRPQESTDKVFMAKIWNDGYKKLKGKRVEASGSQLSEVLAEFKKFRAGKKTSSRLVTVIKAEDIMKVGAEFCPEQYLPQPDFPEEEQERYREDVVKSILRTAVSIDDIADEVIPNFPELLELPELPYGKEYSIEKFFYVKVGKSSGESNYNDGSCPYVSSGDPLNSIIRLVGDVDGEVFEDGAITVTCFGRASVQPWRFMARGNGGSSVRVLIPKYKMTFSELVWFAGQINMQRWRFFYGRMAILKRLKGIRLVAPKEKINDTNKSISDKVAELSKKVTDILGE